MAKHVVKRVSQPASSKARAAVHPKSAPKAGSPAGKPVAKTPEKTQVVRSPEHERVEIIIRKKLYGEAPEEKHFVVSDGRKLKNVKELIEALETMSDDIFTFHVNEFKNDFATWLRDVFSFEGMARELESTKHRLEAQRVLMKKLISEIEDVAK